MKAQQQARGWAATLALRPPLHTHLIEGRSCASQESFVPVLESFSQIERNIGPSMTSSGLVRGLHTDHLVWSRREENGKREFQLKRKEVGRSGARKRLNLLHCTSTTMFLRSRYKPVLTFCIYSTIHRVVQSPFMQAPNPLIHSVRSTRAPRLLAVRFFLLPLSKATALAWSLPTLSRSFTL